MDVPSPAAGPPTPATTGAVLAPVRDRYLDLLRAVALGRVVVLHASTAAWLTFFPAMGVMFALAGSLMARSLDQRPTGQVMWHRSRRLLLPLAVYSGGVVGALIAQGWRPAAEAGGWWGLLLWFVPVGDPVAPASVGTEGGITPTDWGFWAAELLWYIRAYFWFVLLSPLLLRAFRARPVVTLAAPLALIAVLTTGIVDVPALAAAEVWDLGTYGACWILGFGHHDGVLRRLTGPAAVAVGGTLMATGLALALTQAARYGWDLGANSLAQATWSLGVCLLLLRISPSWARLPARLRFLDTTVTLMNNRAVTIYLWHTVALMLVVACVDRLWAVPSLDATVPWLLDSTFLLILLLLPLLALTILAIGWVEDVAARRPPRLWPSGRGRPTRAAG